MHVDLAVAEHEAAHVVVGVALGLPFKSAAVGKFTWRRSEIEGYTWFGGLRNHLAHGILACAGIAWESRPNGNPTWAEGDMRLAREYLRPTTRGGSTSVNVVTGVRIANELLGARRAVHRKLADALCDGALGPRDIRALVLGV